MARAAERELWHHERLPQILARLEAIERDLAALGHAEKAMSAPLAGRPGPELAAAARTLTDALERSRPPDPRLQIARLRDEWGRLERALGAEAAHQRRHAERLDQLGLRRSPARARGGTPATRDDRALRAGRRSAFTPSRPPPLGSSRRSGRRSSAGSAGRGSWRRRCLGAPRSSRARSPAGWRPASPTSSTSRPATSQGPRPAPRAGLGPRALAAGRGGDRGLPRAPRHHRRPTGARARARGAPRPRRAPLVERTVEDARAELGYLARAHERWDTERPEPGYERGPATTWAAAWSAASTTGRASGWGSRHAPWRCRGGGPLVRVDKRAPGGRSWDARRVDYLLLGPLEVRDDGRAVALGASPAGAVRDPHIERGAHRVGIAPRGRPLGRGRPRDGAEDGADPRLAASQVAPARPSGHPSSGLRPRRALRGHRPPAVRAAPPRGPRGGCSWATTPPPPRSWRARSPCGGARPWPSSPSRSRGSRPTGWRSCASRPSRSGSRPISPSAATPSWSASWTRWSRATPSGRASGAARCSPSIAPAARRRRSPPTRRHGGPCPRSWGSSRRRSCASWSAVSSAKIPGSDADAPPPWRTGAGDSSRGPRRPPPRPGRPRAAAGRPRPAAGRGARRRAAGRLRHRARPGIGKTTLVEAFAERASTAGAARASRRGQCIAPPRPRRALHAGPRGARAARTAAGGRAGGPDARRDGADVAGPDAVAGGRGGAGRRRPPPARRRIASGCCARSSRPSRR